MARKSTPSVDESTQAYLNKLNKDVSSNQSRLSLILGALIVLVAGILIFNYFNRNSQQEVGPAQQIAQEEDVSPEDLPGKYTVKEGDTLFLIAQKYYNDGYKYPEIAKENNLTNVNQIEVGQVLEIPKLEGVTTPSPEEGTLVPTPTPAGMEQPSGATPGSKGAPDVTMTQQNWGPPITSETYKVAAGDWLSKIAGRAYGDIMAFDRIAKANNISNPDIIEVGQVLAIPR